MIVRFRVNYLKGNGNIVSALIDFLSYAITKKVKRKELMNFVYSAHPELTPLPFVNPIITACENAQ